MKKMILSSLIAAMALLVTSCNSDKELDLPNYYVYATLLDKSDSYSFAMDDSKTFIVSETRVSVNSSYLTVGSRYVVGVTFSEPEADSSYDYSAVTYDIIEVAMGDCRVVTDQSESDDIADDEFSYISTAVSLSYEYLNLLVGYKTDNLSGANFYLVENQMENTEIGNLLYLELRYDSATTSTTGVNYESYVSFNMNSFRDKLEGKSGIVLRINTLISGVQDIEIDATNLFE